MATSGKQLSSLPRTTNIGGDNSILTWLGNGNAEQIAKKDFFTGTPIAYRQPSTTYAVGNIAYHSALPTGWYLECTTKGTSGSGDLSISSPSIGGTVTDGTVVWMVCKDIGTGNAPIYAGFNQKQTFTSSGSFTAPVTGTYKITLQGGGGGGGGAGTNPNLVHSSGGGGGAGAKLVAYEKLTAGTTYSFTVGAGGTGGTAGSSSTAGMSGGGGGATTITISNNAYSAGGGGAGHLATGSNGGTGKISNTTVSRGQCGTNGQCDVNKNAMGGTGGGTGGGTTWGTGGVGAGFFGGGGGGGTITENTYYNGYAGGNGYITFEWLDSTLL